MPLPRGQHVDGLKESEIDAEAYTRNLVYEPVTDVFGMLGGAFGKVGRVYSQALFQKRLLVGNLTSRQNKFPGCPN